MIFGLANRALIGWVRLALTAVMLVFIPMADASACAKESAGIETAVSVEQSAVDVGGQNHSDQQPGDLSHCVHGHCHQAMGIANPVGIDVQWTAKAPLIASVNAGALLPHVAAGLERPPKA